MATSSDLQQLYLAYFGRPPEPAALSYYAGQTVAQVEAAFQASPEGQKLYAIGGGKDDAQLVSLVYQHLFNRLPSVSEIQYWVNVGGALGLPQPALSQLIASSAQNSDISAEANRMAYVQEWAGIFGTLVATKQVSTADATALAVLQLAGITADPGTLVAANTGTTNTLSPPPAPSPAPPAPSPAPAPASNIFTTGTDHLTTADASVVFTATLEGTSPTLTAGDSLAGAGNTLNVTDTDGGTPDQWPTGFGLTGVSTLSLTTAGDAGSSATPLDTSFSNVVTHFTLNSTGTGVDYLLGGTATALTINSSAGSVQVSGGFRSLNVTDNNLGGTHALSLAGTGGAVTLHDPSGPTSLIISVDALTLTGGFTDASNKITSLTLAGSTNLSTIDAITDTALATLTVTGNVTLGVRSCSPLFLGANVTTVDLSGDTDTAGTHYFSIGSSNVTFKVAADTTVVNTAVFAGPTIAFGSITSGLGNHGGGPIVASGGHAGAAFVSDLLAAINGPKDVEYGNDGSNTYIVESDDGSSVQGNGHVRIVEIVGVSTVTVHASNVSIS